ncbi:MAG: cell division protein ZipA [Vibrionaceae bacterium]
MQDLRLVIIVIGAVAIVGLLLHGLWTNKKEQPAKFGDRPSKKTTNSDGFDDHGLSSVRVVKAAQPESNDEDLFGAKSDNTYIDPLFAEDKQPEASGKKNKPQTKAMKDFYQLDEIDEEKFALEEELLQKEQISPIDAHTEPSASAASEKPAPKAIDPMILMLNVQTIQPNNEFNGEDIVGCLEKFGLLFGEMDIFHRHMDLSGTGKVLFSAANMFNPGSFPVSNLHQFSTPGITFFMMLPCSGEAEQNFNLMLQTAQQVANQLGGSVTDQEHSMLTPQRIEGYREKIKQFAAYA